MNDLAQAGLCCAKLTAVVQLHHAHTHVQNRLQGQVGLWSFIAVAPKWLGINWIPRRTAQFETAFAFSIKWAHWSSGTPAISTKRSDGKEEEGGVEKGRVSPLYTKLISLMILCRLVPPSFTCISTSVGS